MSLGGKMSLAALMGVAAGAGAVALYGSAGDPAAGVAKADRAAIEAIVKEYILSHPEILPQAMERLHAREASKVIDANRELIETPFGSSWEGAKDADVVLVEFVDFSCGFCRSSVADVDRLLAEDKKLKVVYRQLPVLGPPSESAAKAALGVAKHGNYPAFHRALYAAGRPNDASIAAARERAGAAESVVKQSAASQETRDEIANNLDLMRALQVTGTPAWVVGSQVLHGAVGYDELKKAIAEARSAK